MLQLFLSHSKSIKTNIVVPFSNDLSLLGVPYWFDRSVISSGKDIYAHIIDGINRSSYCIAFINNTYLQSEWPLKELELFHAKELQFESSLIIPVYCGIPKESVYKIVPWLKDRAFEKTKKEIFEDGERESIVCRVINRLLEDKSADPDISILEKLTLHNTILPFNDIFHILYYSQYYTSADLRLACIELCNILALLNVVYTILNIPKDNLKNSIFKMPSYVKKIAVSSPNNLNYDYIVMLKRSINFVSSYLL